MARLSESPVNSPKLPIHHLPRYFPTTTNFAIDQDHHKMASSGKGKAPAKGKEHDENEAPKLNLDRVLSEKEMLAKDLESKTAELAKSQAQVAAMERLLLEVAVGMHQQGKKHAKHVDVDEVMETIAEIKSSTHGSSIPGKFKPPKNLPAEDIVSAACRLFLAAESKRDAMLADAEAEKEAILAEKGAILSPMQRPFAPMRRPSRSTQAPSSWPKSSGTPWTWTSCGSG
jgi:hypothetical protein